MEKQNETEDPQNSHAVNKSIPKGQNEKKLSSFFVRLVSGIVLLLLLFIILPAGGNLLLFFNFILSVFACYELLHCFSFHKEKMSILPYLFISLHYLSLYYGRHFEMALMLVYFILLCVDYVLFYPEKTIKEICLYFLILPYAGIMFSYLYQTRGVDHGQILVWLIFLSSWAADTCAYAVGILIGKHKMTPILSPKKTWEGAIGGIVGSFLLTFLYGLYNNQMHDGFFPSPLKLAISVAFASLFSIVGDLTASGIKRDFGIKDYSNLIPGHGGVLDRFDSALFTAPIIYFALVLFVK